MRVCPVPVRPVLALVMPLLAALALLAGCTSGSGGPVFHAEHDPETLEEWRLLQIRDGALVPREGVIAYDLNTPLFSDYAHKLRTVWIPAGARARYGAAGELDLPVGSIVSKTFYYPRASVGSGSADGARTPEGTGPSMLQRTSAAVGLRAGGRLELAALQLIETRLLVRRKTGWHAVSYVWDAAQRSARRERAGAILPLELVGVGRFDYVVPDVNQCAACHATDVKRSALAPIGLKARHLDRDHDYGGAIGQRNQLAHLAELGVLESSPMRIVGAARWDDESRSIDDRARAYLDINCAHCHNRLGPADTSGLSLDAMETSPIALGLCKSPIAAGRGTGNRKFDIVPGRPDESIMVYRLASTDPGEMMPELGRALSHDEGVALIRQWVERWPSAPGCAQEASNSARHSASSARLSRSQG